MRMLPFPWLLALSLVTVLADGVQAAVSIEKYLEALKQQ